MCHKCVRKGRRHLARTGLLNFYAHFARKGYGIPLFTDRASNFYIEGKIWEDCHPNKKRYSRKGRNHNLGLED